MILLYNSGYDSVRRRTVSVKIYLFKVHRHQNDVVDVLVSLFLTLNITFISLNSTVEFEQINVCWGCKYSSDNICKYLGKLQENVRVGVGFCLNGMSAGFSLTRNGIFDERFPWNLLISSERPFFVAMFFFLACFLGFK